MFSKSASLLLLLGGLAGGADLSHYSAVLKESRNYRIFLPSDYASSTKHYPVVYFFHGYGERFNTPSAEVGDYDGELASYAASHDLIIVKPDGSNPGTKRPYNECPYDAPKDCATGRDFVGYFLELVSHIDSEYRSIPNREHRAVSGVSIGGWFSYFLAWKFPDRIASASSFMGSAEFVIEGTEWSPTHQYANYEATRTRLVTGSKDFIRWYHRELNSVWKSVRPSHETEDFPSAHGTPGMAKTLDFHMRAFDNPLRKPYSWTHSDTSPKFTVWGYSVESSKKAEGFITLANVTNDGFLTSSPTPLTIVTDTVYAPRQHFRISIAGKQSSAFADRDGRLKFSVPAGSNDIIVLPNTIVTGYRLVSPDLPMAGGTLRIAVQRRNEAEEEIKVPVPDPQQEVIKAAGLYIPLVPRAGGLDGVVISDGASRPLWQHAVQKTTATLGRGNGDGVANVGESIAFLLEDRGGEVLAAHSCLEFEAPVRDQWGSYDHVGATRKYSILRVTPRCPAGQDLPVFVRFTFPNAPEHVVKQGVFRFRINESRKKSAALGDTRASSAPAE